MKQLIIFGIISIPSLYLSWRSLFTVRSHGFYRFFGWECTIWLFSANYPYWFKEPFSGTQIASWVLLFVSIYLVIAGGILLIKKGKPSNAREDETLMSFEKTTDLIDTGLYAYIRHPLYASLLYLTWGISLKNPVISSIAVAVAASFFYFMTSRLDEKECIVYFGEKYSEYMKRSKMFVPFVF
jgi:protein-S-isoprenylcysteine O-methyltransferase Ste14